MKSQIVVDVTMAFLHPLNPYSVLLVTSYWALPRKDSLCMLCAQFCVSRKGGTGDVGGVTHRVTCTWWWLGLAVKAPWLGQFLPWLHGQA